MAAQSLTPPSVCVARWLTNECVRVRVRAPLLAHTPEAPKVIFKIIYLGTQARRRRGNGDNGKVARGTAAVETTVAAVAVEKSYSRQ